MKGSLQNLLLVSDDRHFSETLKQLLRANGGETYQITCIYPLEKALDMLDQHDYSLVVLDLPQETACSEVAQRVRKSFGRLPVILLSSSGYQQAISAIRQGIQQVVDKSRVDQDMMLQTIMSSIERSRMENELHIRDNILQAVNYAAEMFLTQPNWDERLDDILERLRSATESDRAFIYQNIRQPDGETVARLFFEHTGPGVDPYSESEKMREIPHRNPGFGKWFEQFAQGQVVFGDLDDLNPGERELMESWGVKSFMIVPIFYDQTWWGFVGFKHCHKPKHWSAAEKDAIKTSASMIGAAIARQEAEERMKYLATHDYLTGLPNRLLFSDRYQQAVSRAARSGEKVGIICLDLDKFKHVNDTHGHPVGDQALIEVGERLQRSLRASDTCARIGGDEFGVVADCLHCEEDLSTVMIKLAESLRDGFNLNNSQIFISASMGASIYPDHGADLEKLMSSADKALYQIKGRQPGYKIFNRGEQYPLLQE